MAGNLSVKTRVLFLHVETCKVCSKECDAVCSKIFACANFPRSLDVRVHVRSAHPVEAVHNVLSFFADW